MNKYNINSNNTQHMTNTNNHKEVKVYTDYDIFKGKVRLVQDGKAPIVIERDDAIELAKNENKNLVQIAYNKNDFPHAICKIIDYGKFKYEQQKKEKEAKKAAKAAQSTIKEICFSIRIDDNDFNVKVNHIKTFLSEHNTKVKITIKLSRREMNLLGMAKDMMRKILSQLDNLAELDSNPSFNSGILCCVVRSIC